MDFEKIKNLMNTLEKSNLMDFELKLNDGFYLRMNKYTQSSVNVFNQDIQKLQLDEENVPKNVNSKSLDSLAENISEPITILPEEKEEIKEGNIITSPIVGTFYSKASPSKPDFVKKGDIIKKGDTLCIIEAMKVMNEIISTYTGEVVEIFALNDEMVEYGQPLFRIV